MAIVKAGMPAGSVLLYGVMSLGTKVEDFCAVCPKDNGATWEIYHAEYFCDECGSLLCDEHKYARIGMRASGGSQSSCFGNAELHIRVGQNKNVEKLELGLGREYRCQVCVDGQGYDRQTAVGYCNLCELYLCAEHVEAAIDSGYSIENCMGDYGLHNLGPHQEGLLDSPRPFEPEVIAA